MKIATTYLNGEIFGHFGHTEQFKIYEVKEGKIIGSEIVNTNGSGHGALANLLSSLGVNILICGGIGGGAKIALANAGIQLFGGVVGNSDSAVENFLMGKLIFNPEVQCNHHSEHNGEHKCGEHGCGSHTCHK